MRILYIGGISSGKSALAEAHTLKLAKRCPYYLATTEFMDKESKRRIKRHKKKRQGGSFYTIEEPLKLAKALKRCDDAVLVEDMSTWLSNMLYHRRHKKIKKELKRILAYRGDVVFVAANVGESVVSANKEARRFCAYNGKMLQQLAKHCERVYHVVGGIATAIK